MKMLEASSYKQKINEARKENPIKLATRVSMLNVDQRRVYELITKHLLHEQQHELNQCQCSNLNPLHMFVSGLV